MTVKRTHSKTHSHSHKKHKTHKRPLNAFAKFIKEHYKALRMKHPKASRRSMFQMLASMYRKHAGKSDHRHMYKPVTAMSKTRKHKTHRTKKHRTKKAKMA